MEKTRLQSGDDNHRKVEKRNRPPISCEPCRIRKLKCNRELPCDTCVKRNKHPSCEYASNANRSKPKRGNATNRLENLENMVLQFVQNGMIESSQGKERSNFDKTAKSPMLCITTDVREPTKGTFHATAVDGQINYVDSSHWLSVLNDIKEVREQLSLADNPAQVDQLLGDMSSQPEVDMVFGQLAPTTLNEIIQSLPPRPVCDGLISYYFNFPYIVLPFIHPSKFQNEYEQFWKDPSTSSILWIGLLFSILGFASTLRLITSTSNESGGHTLSPAICRLRTTQCLVLGKYATAKAFGLETLVMHLLSNLVGLVDSHVNLWFLMGIIIRLAMRMGYHRDSRNQPNISTFEGEMRRRLWHPIFQLDALMSFQAGIPSMIPTNYCDTEPPRNLQFSDFHPNSAVLPPSRPLSDSTPILYTIVKCMVMKVFKKITSHTQSLSAPLLETTIMLDMEMRDVYDKLPSDWKMISVSRSLTDSPATIMKRCSIELLYLKGIIVLHRRFLSVDTLSTKYAMQRRACLEAAMGVLARQADLHQACMPGGQLFADQWMVSSLIVYDFLLAAMVVCLNLSVHRRTATVLRDAEFASQLNALQTSHAIWTTRTPRSKEASTAAHVLALMIRTVQDDSTNNSLSSLSPEEDSYFPYAEPVVEMIDGPEIVDWTLLDQYFQDTNGHLNDTYSEQGNDIFQDLGPDWMGYEEMGR